MARSYPPAYLTAPRTSKLRRATVASLSRDKAAKEAREITRSHGRFITNRWNDGWTIKMIAERLSSKAATPAARTTQRKSLVPAVMEVLKKAIEAGAIKPDLNRLHHDRDIAEARKRRRAAEKAAREEQEDAATDLRLAQLSPPRPIGS